MLMLMVELANPYMHVPAQVPAVNEEVWCLLHQLCSIIEITGQLAPNNRASLVVVKTEELLLLLLPVPLLLQS